MHPATEGEPYKVGSRKISSTTEELINAATPEGGKAGGQGDCSTIGAGFNVLCTVVGTGLLQLPKGCAQSGWIGVGLLTLLGIMATYTARIIPLSLDLIRQRRPHALLGGASCAAAQTYGDIGEAAFGKRGRWFVTAQQHIAQVMVATIQHLLACFTLHELLRHTLPWLTYNLMVLFISAILWFHVFLKTLGDVAFLSYFNISISVALLLVVIVVALNNPPDETPHTTVLNPSALSVGYAFASFGFSYGVHPVLPTVYYSMKRPDRYGPMIYTTFALIICVFYLPMIIIGYKTYGDDVATPIYETAGLQHSKAVTIVKYLIVVMVMLTYPLLLCNPEIACESSVTAWLSRSPDSPSARTLLPRPVLLRMLVRSCFVVFTAAVTLALRTPAYFGPFLNLVASCTATFANFVLPSAFYVKIRGTREMHWFEVAWNVWICGFAFVGAGFGAVSAIHDFIELAQNGG